MNIINRKQGIILISTNKNKIGICLIYKLVAKGFYILFWIKEYTVEIGYNKDRKFYIQCYKDYSLPG